MDLLLSSPDSGPPFSPLTGGGGGGSPARQDAVHVSVIKRRLEIPTSGGAASPSSTVGLSSIRLKGTVDGDLTKSSYKRLYIEF